MQNSYWEKISEILPDLQRGDPLQKAIRPSNYSEIWDEIFRIVTGSKLAANQSLNGGVSILNSPVPWLGTAARPGRGKDSCPPPPGPFSRQHRRSDRAVDGCDPDRSRRRTVFSRHARNGVMNRLFGQRASVDTDLAALTPLVDVFTLVLIAVLQSWSVQPPSSGL